MNNLYFVDNEHATMMDHYDADMIDDGSTQVWALAASETDAMELAALYDANAKQPDNCMWRGETIVALQRQDRA